jgi:signal peptidase I
MENAKEISDFTHRSTPYLRTLCSLVLPGTGQAYHGQWKKAVAFLVVRVIAVLFPILILTLPGKAGAFLEIFCRAIVVLAIVISAIDAWKMGKREKFQHPPAGLKWALIYVGVCGVLALSEFGLRRYYIDLYSTPTARMVPTILTGEKIAANKTLSWSSDKLAKLKRADVVVYNEQTTPHVGRIIGLPGDEVEFRKGQLFLNGAPIPQKKAQEAAEDHCEVSANDEYCLEESLDGKNYLTAYTKDAAKHLITDLKEKVPEGDVYILGDNRDNSWDSRYQGAVPAEHVIGKVVKIYFSRDDKNIRWHRLGRPVD